VRIGKELNIEPPPLRLATPFPAPRDLETQSVMCVGMNSSLQKKGFCGKGLCDGQETYHIISTGGGRA